MRENRHFGSQGVVVVGWQAVLREPLANSIFWDRRTSATHDLGLQTTQSSTHHPGPEAERCKERKKAMRGKGRRVWK